MTKVIRVWAIKLSPALVELKVTTGNSTIIRSTYKKNVKIPNKDPWTGKTTQVPTEIIMKQTYITGGRSLGVYPTSCLAKLGVTRLANDDLALLKAPYTTLVRSLEWRRANL
jgi:hypothetical protein